MKAVFFDADGNKLTAWTYNGRHITTDLIATVEGAVKMGVNFYGATNTTQITTAEVLADIKVYSMEAGESEGGSSVGNIYTRLRVAAWNVGNWGQGASFSKITNDNYLVERAKFRKTLNAIGADFMCISEFESTFNTSTGETADAAVFPQYAFGFGGTEGGGNGYLGQKIYGNLRCESMQQVALSTSADHYLLELKYVINGKSVIIGCVHLDWSTAEQHTLQLNNLLARYADNNDDAIIIGGDFNHLNGMEEEDIALIEAAGFTSANWSYMGKILTGFGNVVASNYLDNIMVKNCKIIQADNVIYLPEGASADDVSSATADEWKAVNASDHFPIYADIVIP
jgi:endonuclease/exonuclease/phosphatase family metal-dependent hydrolase